MHRTNIYLTDAQRGALAARASSDGTTVAELVRRLIDRALADEGDDVAADVAAIDGSFGALRDVQIDLDRADGERARHLERIARL